MDHQLHLSCCRWKRNDIALFCRRRCEGNPLRLRNAVFAPQVTISFHRQCAAVLVSKPARNSWNVNAAFDAAGCEQVPQIVMCDAICSDFFARSIEGFLAFADTKYFCVQRFIGTFTPHSLKQRASIGNQRHAAQFPILRAGF